MRSLDRCDCGGYMRTQTTRATKFGVRIRYLKCSDCGVTGNERIQGEPRPRPKKSSNLETTRGLKGRIVVALGAAIGKMKASTSHVATGSQTGRKTMLLSIFQLAEKLDIDWQTCRDWIEFGYCPAPIIAGGLLRFRQADLDEWLRAGCKPGPMLSETDCGPFWDALLHELELNERNKT